MESMLVDPMLSHKTDDMTLSSEKGQNGAASRQANDRVLGGKPSQSAAS
jgi:hypothetical protein